MEIPTELPIADPHTNAELQGNLLRNYEHKFEQLPEDQKLTKLCSATPVWRLLKKDNSSLHLMKKKDLTKWWICVESTPYLEVKKHPEWEGGFSETRKSAWSWMWRSAFIKGVTVLKSWSNLCFETEQFFGFELWMELTNCQKPFFLKALSCEGQATTKACYDIISHFNSSSWKKMDRHQSWEISSRLFCSVKSHDPIAATWSINSSRRWWSSTIWRYHGRVQGANYRLDIFLANGGGPKKRFQYWLNPNSSKHFLYFRAIQDIQEVISLISHIARQCTFTERLRRLHLPHLILKSNNRTRIAETVKKLIQQLEPPEQGVFPAGLE